MSARPPWWPTAEQKLHADAACAHPSRCNVQAVPGQRETCAGCGRVVELASFGTDAFTSQPLMRWRAVRKTTRAPIPGVCPATGRRKTYHRPARFGVDGTRSTEETKA